MSAKWLEKLGPLKALGARIARAKPVEIALLAFLSTLVVYAIGLGRFGFWDPLETNIVELVSAMGEKGSTILPAHPPLQLRLLRFGSGLFGTSEFGLRITLSLVGAIGVGAVAYAAALLWSRRAALFSALALGTSATYLFQSRQLGGDVTGMAATALVFAAIAKISTYRPRSWGPLDIAGVCLLTPIAALAAAYSAGLTLGLGLPLVGAGVALCALCFARISGDTLGKSQRAFYRNLGLGALALGLGVVGFGAYQLFFAPAEGGYSHMLRAVVRPKVDLRAQFDSVFQYVGFGMFPWSGLVVAGALWAIGGALKRPDVVTEEAARAGDDASDLQSRKMFGTFAVLVWSLAGFIALSLWADRVGPITFFPLPACALLAGMMLADLTSTSSARSDSSAAYPVVGLIALLTTIVLARDFNQFPQKLASLPFATELTWPTLPNGIAAEQGLRNNLVAVAIIFGAFSFILAWSRGEAVARPRSTQTGTLRRVGRAWLDILDYLTTRLGGLFSTVTLTSAALICALFLSLSWTPRLSVHFSYRKVFDRYHALAQGNESLAVMGVDDRSVKMFLGNTAVTHQDDVSGLLEFLRNADRRFAIAPSERLANLQQTASQMGVTYYVVDKTNAKYWLLSNQLREGEKDSNELSKYVLKAPPADYDQYLKLDATFDGRIKLIGVSMPTTISNGSSFTMKLLYQVIAPVGGNWKVFVHFDGAGTRFFGDHDPVKKLYGTAFWSPGDYIVDEFSVKAGGFATATGEYQVMTGFWPGGDGARMKLTAPTEVTPEGINGGENRVRLPRLRIQ